VTVRLGVLASGRGSNLQALLDAERAGTMPATVAVVLANKADAHALARAKAADVPAHFVDPKGLTREAHEALMTERLREARVDFVCLAGYMRVLTPSFVATWRERLINIHPSLLPAFPGLDAQRQAFEAGVRVAGATTHFVDDGVDQGPIILQAAVPVLEGDTRDALAARILEVEHRLYPLTVKLLAEGRVRLDGRRVRISGALPAGVSTASLFPPDVTK